MSRTERLFDRCEAEEEGDLEEKDRSDVLLLNDISEMFRCGRLAVVRVSNPLQISGGFDQGIIL